MSEKRGNTRSELKSLLKAYSILLLVLLYLVGSARIESVHQLFVQHAAPVLHAQEQEKDPCHRSIYHQERSADCKHTTHIVDNHKCPMCDSQVHTVQIHEDNLGVVSPFFESAISTISQSTTIAGYYSYSSSRAPPFM